MKEKSSSETKPGRVAKPRGTRKKHGPVQREVNEVMAELVLKLSQKLEPQPERAREKEGRRECVPGPNRDRLTVGVDLGDQWSNYCILGLDGETLAEGQLPTTRQDFAEFFQAMAAARVVMEVGTHSAWGRDVVAGCGHEALVANSRQMEGPKRRKRKNDRIDGSHGGLDFYDLLIEPLMESILSGVLTSKDVEEGRHTSAGALPDRIH
jgi:hypothetical protein